LQAGRRLVLHIAMGLASNSFPMRTDISYWFASAPSRTPYDGVLPEDVDCAIVGGGYTGLSAAYHMAQQGIKAAVLEQEHIGWGASGRNGGMVLPGFKQEVHTLIKRHGLKKARALYDLSTEAVMLVKSLVKSNNIDCDLQETGYFYAAWKPAHLRGMTEWQRTMSDHFGHPTRLVTQAQMQAEELGTSRYHGGLVDDFAAGLHPAKYVAGLARIAAQAGACLYDNTEVQSLKKTVSGFEVSTNRGVLRSREVVIATNGYTGGLVPFLQRRIIPVGSYIIATSPLDPALANRLIPSRRMIFDSKHMLYYFRILPDNRMLFGGRASWTPTTPEKSADILRRSMIELFPELAKVDVEYSWGGTLGFTFDLMPHSGSMDGIHYALGYGGHGVAFATYMGKQLADLAAGKISSLPVSEIGFPGMILYRRNPWFLPLAGLYYGFLDRIS
jgi:glycine/D-amino acid oxidase-like deaminating enzyme